jgi:flagellar motor switch/type III secretory pathway protein FliN
VRLDAFATALQEILGAEARVRVRRAQPWAPSRVSEGRIGVLLGRGSDDPSSAGALVEVEQALAAEVVARAMRRAPPVAVKGMPVPDDALAGAFAAVVVAAARRAHAGGPPRVLSVGGADVLESELARASPDVVTMTLTVLVADSAFDARLSVSRDASFPVPEVPWTMRRLSSLGETPLSIPVVACATTATVADVAALHRGDVWLPGTWDLTTEANTVGATLVGPVLLAAPSSATGIRARLVEGGRLVLSGEVEALGAAEGDMIEADGADALLNAVGDVPVVVRVEVGEALMTAREWASVGRGDVVTLGRRVGAPVLLRVGGVPVARGELVNVEGEVGVRISERVAGEPAGA